jgi:hypothetical protein
MGLGFKAVFEKTDFWEPNFWEPNFWATLAAMAKPIATPQLQYG